MEKTFRIILFIIFLVILFLVPKASFAISAPVLSSPSDSSTVSSGPTLNWEAVSDAIQYKVIVDDEYPVTSPYIKGPYYTTNTKYSPQMSNGTFYWKVAAKDGSGAWSDWSSIWSFTLSSASPTPTVPEESYFTPYSTPYSTPSSPPDPTPTTSSKSSFLISDIPSSIDSDKPFTVSVNLNLPNNPSSIFYLKGAFKKEGGSNYFGFTKVSFSWIKNGSSYSSQYQITTDSSGAWSGTLDVKPDDTDSGFTGTGDYIFKVGRYTSSGSGPTWSNEQTININEVAHGEVSSETGDSEVSDLPIGSTVQASSKNSQKISNPGNSYKTPKIAGVSIEATSSSTSSTPEPTKEVSKNNTFNFIPVIGVVMILSGLGSLIYIYHKQKLQSNA